MINVYSDTDWAGCPRTRKSTSGGCLMVGNHVIKTWSSTQASLALSSGEAEYYGVVRASGVGLGQQALFRDAGLRLSLRVWTDSSAAIGTASCQGLGKLHVECHSLWLQQRLRRKEFELRKIAGEENPGELFTKHLESAGKLKQLMSLFNCEFTPGRTASAPNLKRAATADKPASNSGQAAFLAQLPHLMTSREMDRNFPKVMPVNEYYGEEDMPIEEELGDPVPRLTRSATKSTRARTGQADGRGRSDQRGRAHIVTGAGSTCDVQESERRGAAPVGRCLVGQPRCKGIERGCADKVAEGARPRPSRTEATAYRTEATACRTEATAYTGGIPVCRLVYIYPQLLPNEARTPFPILLIAKKTERRPAHKHACKVVFSHGQRSRSFCGLWDTWYT